MLVLAIFGDHAWLQNNIKDTYFHRKWKIFKINYSGIRRIHFKIFSIWGGHVCTIYDFPNVSFISEICFISKNDAWNVKLCFQQIWFVWMFFSMIGIYHKIANIRYIYLFNITDRKIIMNVFLINIYVGQKIYFSTLTYQKQWLVTN